MISQKLKPALCAATALSAAYAMPAFAQESEGEAAAGSDIIVTARRTEERLQDVPISITVFNQEQLDNNNVTSARDLVTYTPGLAANNRFGADSTTFTIRGFTQEQRTYATVGTYFADVVAPRGSGASFGGDGAGPGALFDLQNVQVLKGPQGTLFGRNSTGGAVLLVPNKPTDRLEGYVEGSAGNYDMWRVQGVVNVPVMDTLRVRVGVDHMDRHGYLKNIGIFGDGRQGDRGMGDVDYWTGRISAVADLSPDVENYTIVSYTKTQSNGVIPKITSNGTAHNPTGAFPTVPPFGAAAAAQVARESAHGFWTVSNRIPDSASETETWQIINTTTWTVSDSLTVKNIFSYGEFRGTTNLELFGNYFITPGVTPGTEQPNQVNGFAFTSAEPNFGYTNAQSSLVEELQFQGRAGDGRFIWQAGLYMELNTPLGFSGVQTASFTPCTDITVFNCNPPGVNGSAGTGSYSISQTWFRNYAVYGQASYDITEQLKVTGGIRYTWDKMRTQLHNLTMLFTNPPSAVRFRCSNITVPGYTGSGAPGTTFPFVNGQQFSACGQHLSKNTSDPTWLLGLDYKPIEDVLLYAKYSRGYRQGGLTIFGPDPIQAFDAEKVDTYEAGAKANWSGAVPGYFNISGFYNDFSNQQVQFGVACVPQLPGFTTTCAGNAAILNAGSSELYGFEAEAGITPFEGMRLEASYAYLKTQLKELTVPPAGSVPPYNSFTTPVVGDVIPNSGPPHKLVASASYTLPLSESIGKITIGGTYVYQSKYRAVADGVVGSGNGILPSANIFNANLTWEDVAALPVDASVFVTNLTNEHVYLHGNDNELRGFVSYFIGEPRMWGVRLRYKFGN